MDSTTFRAATLVIREATPADLPALVALHVTTFNETHGPGPSQNVRMQQWGQLFARADGSWFVLVIETPMGELVGFARGERYTEPDPPGFAGLLNKIYILRRHHRQGLGRRLIGQVARRFLADGVSSMLLFGDKDSPSNAFYEAMGGEKLFAPNGEFHGGYGWRDLAALAALTPAG